MSALRPPTLWAATHEACQPSALDIDGIFLRREGELGCTEPPHRAQLVDWHHPTTRPSHASVRRMAKDVAANRRAGHMCQWSAARNVCAADLGPPALDRCWDQAALILHRPHLLAAIKRGRLLLARRTLVPTAGICPNALASMVESAGSRQINSRPEGTLAPSVSW